MKLPEIDGFGEVVEGPGAQRLHGVFRGAVGCHDDAALAALLGLQLLQFQPQPSGRRQAGQQHVRLRLQRRARAPAAAGDESESARVLMEGYRIPEDSLKQ